MSFYALPGCLRAAIYIRKNPTKLHTQNQIRISICSLSHFTDVYLLPYLQTSLSYRADRICKNIWFWLPFDQNCFFFKHVMLQICRICIYFIAGPTVRKFYTLDVLQYFTNSFLCLLKMCDIQCTWTEVTKCFKSSRSAYVHINLPHSVNRTWCNCELLARR
jgi:hypothetical protein